MEGPDLYSFSLTQQDLRFNGVSFYPSFCKVIELLRSRQG